MPIGAVILMVGILSVGIFIIFNSSKSRKQQEIDKIKFYRKAFKFLSNFFLTQGKMLAISTQLSALSIYSKAEIQMLATQYFIMSASISGGLVVAAIFLFNDTVSTLICIAFAVVINNVLINKQIEKVNLKVYKALKHSISAIRQEYLKLGSVPEAIADADIHPMLRKPFDEIYTILTSANGELKLLKFYEANPFRSLQTFAGISYNINNSGDGSDEYGQSNYVQALTMLSSDVNSEVQRLVTLKAKFGLIEYLPLAPIFVINFIENYFMGIMPGTALIYNGVLGYLGRTLTLLACIVSYKIVSSINSAAPIKEDDRSSWSIRLLEKESWRQFIYNITPKNAKGKKIEKNLKSALSRKGVDHLYTEKVVWGAVSFVVAIIVTVSMISLGRDFTLNSTQQLSLVATNEMDGFTREQILELDYSYFNRDREWTDEEFREQVKAAMPSLTDLQVLDQVKRIKDKESALLKAYFNWYYMVIIIGISCICWTVPNLGIYLRRNLVRTEAEDDFLQLQTLMAILMNTDIDTLDALWQLTQHSRIHKGMLMYAYHSFPSNPEKEIVRLQSKTPIIEFKRFIGKMSLTISDLSLAEAYSDLKIERDHMLRVREITMYATIDRKRGMCGPISMAPIGFLVVFELLIPLGYLGFNEFMSALGSMG